MKHSASKKAVERYRTRARRKGLVRLELQIPRQDTESFRSLAAILRSTEKTLADRARREMSVLARRAKPHVSLKELLAAAPLEGVDLERSADLGRDVDLG